MRNELIADFTLLNEMPSMSEKKALASKYGIESKRTKEIQNQVLLAMRDERNTRDNFDKDDVKFFYYLNVPETYAKAVPFYENENPKFIKYLVEYHKQIVNNKNLQNKLCYVNSRDCYFVSNADKYTMKRYINVKRFVEEHTPEVIEKKTSEQAILDIIKTRLLIDMKPFHDAYIKRVEKWSTVTYTALPERIKEAMEMLEAANKKLADKTYPSTQAWKEYNKCKANYDKLNAIIKIFPTCEEYVNDCVKRAEITYDHDVNEVVVRIFNKKLNYENIKVTNILDDPKFFDMTITDGNESLHCRSIWAAEYSTKVTAHYRFIIT